MKAAIALIADRQAQAVEAVAQVAQVATPLVKQAALAAQELTTA